MVSAMAFFAYGTYCIWRAKESVENGKEFEYSELLYAEKVGMIYAPPITTVTFYTGDISDSNIILLRLKEIIRKNPWLASTLVYMQEKNERVLKLRYFKNIERAFENNVFYEESITPEDNKLDENFDGDALSALAQKFTVKMGTSCIGREEPLFKVTILKFVDPKDPHGIIKKSALILSLSHVLGDGHTFYSVYSFFDPKTEVNSLQHHRKIEFPDLIDEIYGKELQQYLSTSLIFGVVTTMLFSRKASVFIEYIDPAKIARMKENQLSSKENQNSSSSSSPSSSSSFLSTNDILTSWFFRTMKSSYGIMAVNYRNRLLGYTNHLAGNYEGLLVYHQEDCQTPMDIRESLTIHGMRSKTNRLPSFWESLVFNVSCVTNWSNFYHHLELPNHSFLIHYPLFGSADCPMKDGMVIFKPNEKDMAVIIMSRSISREEDILHGAGGRDLFRN